MKSSLGVAPEGLDPESLSRIRQSLEDPVQRLGHEVFWLHSSPEGVDPNINLATSDGTTAMDGLRSAAGRPPSREQAISLHDLAVLSYARYQRDQGTVDPSETLGLWASVFGSEQFWDYLTTRAADAHDPRLTAAVVEQAREDLPSAVLAPVAARVAQLIDGGDPETAAAALRAIRRSGLPSDAIDSAAQAAIAPIRLRMRDGAKAVDALVGSIPSSEGDSPASRAKFAKAEKTLVERVLAPVARLKTIDPVFNDAALADTAAAAARRLSVAICNVLDDWVWGYVLIRQALEIARTPAYVSQLASEQAKVRWIYHTASARQSIHTGYAVRAVAHIELALPYAPTDAERAEWSSIAIGAREAEGITDPAVERQKQPIVAELKQRDDALQARVADVSEHPLIDDLFEEAEEDVSLAPTWSPSVLERVGAAPERHWGRWAAVLVAAVVVTGLALAHAHSGSNSSGSSPGAGVGAAAIDPAAAPAGQSAPASAECLTRDSLNSTIDLMKVQIAAKRRFLARIHVQEAPLVAALDKIDRDYPSHQLPPDVWSRYVPIRDQYKALEAQANTVVHSGDALISSYNAKVKTYNRLLKEC